MTLREIGHYIQGLSAQEFRDYLHDQAERGREYGAQIITCPGCRQQRKIQGIAIHLMEDDAWTIDQCIDAEPF